MLQATGIDHVVLRVRDLEAMIGFYERALGMTIAKRNDRLGLVHLRCGASLIDLVAVDGPLGRMGGGAPGARERNVDHICLTVREFDPTTAAAHLTACGVMVGETGERFGAGGVGASLYFTDPEGNSWELRG
jgi:catechol 2,3-dioxygenase-like lactoylglutathione lyase family enzyme